jgi:hypothetical protein
MSSVPAFHSLHASCFFILPSLIPSKFPSLGIHVSFLHFYCQRTTVHFFFEPMEQDRVELSTPALSERCSNQLSYCPKIPITWHQRERKKTKKSKIKKELKKCTLTKYLSLRKEVIQSHLPVRLPCYDFTPLTKHTFDSVLHCWLNYRLRVSSTRMV